MMKQRKISINNNRNNTDNNNNNKPCRIRHHRRRRRHHYHHHPVMSMILLHYYSMCVITTLLKHPNSNFLFYSPRGVDAFTSPDLMTTTTMIATTIPDPIIHFSIGAIAGGAGAVAAYPFDYIKSQMQTQYGRETYENGMDAFITTLSTKKNPLVLYKGVGVQVLGIAPEKGIKLGVNDLLQATCSSQMGGFPLWAQIVSGGISGACQVIASSPLEVMKVALQTSDMTISQVWKDVGGISGLFKGAEACIIRDVLFTAICFPLYATLVHDAELPAFVAGAISGVVSSFAATPPDVVKTRILSKDKWSQQKRTTRASLIGTASNGTATWALQEYYISSNQQEVYSENVVPAAAAVGAGATVTAVAVPAATTGGATKTTPTVVAVVDNDSNNSMMMTQQHDSTNNPFQVARDIVEQEGIAVMFSGVTERCIGAIPRFGTTLAMHDMMEQMIAQAGWLSHSIS